MTDQNTTTAAVSKAPEPTADDVQRENQLYAVAVVQKQCGLDGVAATQRVSGMEAHEVADLVAHGRAGRVAECRKLLGF